MADNPVNLPPIKLAVIEAVVTFFETGGTGFEIGERTGYAAIARIPGDRGGLSFGKHQASLTSGNLFGIAEQYCNTPAARYASVIAPHLDDLHTADPEVVPFDHPVGPLLRDAALYDPLMAQVQDAYFYDHFMAPALEAAAGYGFRTPLACAIAYDSTIHSGPGWMRKLPFVEATEAAGAPGPENEKAWALAYVRARRKWLQSLSSAASNTGYRMDAIESIIAAGNWELDFPVMIDRPWDGQSRWFTVTPYDLQEKYLGATLFGDTTFRMSPDDLGTVDRSTSRFYPDGRVRHIQHCLIDAGLMAATYVHHKFGTVTSADGRYGTMCETAVRRLQEENGMALTGTVDTATYLALKDRVKARGRGEAGAGLKPMETARQGTGTTGSITAAAGTGAVGAGAAVTSEVMRRDEIPEAAPADPVAADPAVAEPAVSESVAVIEEPAAASAGEETPVEAAPLAAEEAGGETGEEAIVATEETVEPAVVEPEPEPVATGTVEIPSPVAAPALIDPGLLAWVALAALIITILLVGRARSAAR